VEKGKGAATQGRRATPVCLKRRHLHAFQCRTPANTCNRCRSPCHPPARVACCSSPGRCVPGVCPARPDPPGFSWGRSERGFRGPASIEKFHANVAQLIATFLSLSLSLYLPMFFYAHASGSDVFRDFEFPIVQESPRFIPD
jgi:hypothetical protein